MKTRSWVLVGAALAGCLPTTTEIHNHDTILSTADVESERGTPTLDVVTESSATTLTLTAQRKTPCMSERKQTVRRMQETEVTTNHVAHGLIYVVGLAAGALGGAMIYDSQNSGSAADRAIPIGSSLDDSRNYGIGFAAAGAALLIYAIGSNLNATDKTEMLGNVETPIAGTRHPADCDRSPAGNEYFGLVFATDGAARLYVPLGQTDAQGRLVVTWSTVTSHLPANIQQAGAVVAGTPESVGAALVQNAKLSSLATVTPPVIDDPEKAWAVAIGLNTDEGFRAYQKRFPSSPHAAEAGEHARAATTRQAALDFEAALTANDFDKAARAIDAMRPAADPAMVSSAESRLETARKAGRLRQAREQLPRLMAAIDDAADPAVAIASAKSAIETLRAESPDEAVTADAQLDEARKRVTVKWIHDGEASFAKRDFATGTKQFNMAVTTTKDIPAVEKARTAAIASAVKAGRDEARGLARAGKYDEAMAIADALIAVAPNDKGLAAERAKWDDASKRAAQASMDAQAREEAKQKAQAARDAAREAADQATKDRAAAAQAARDAADQAAKDRAAAAQAARDEQARKDREARTAADQAAKDRAAAAQAAREQKARDAADQKARDVADRRVKQEQERAAAEQRKLEAEAAKARQREADAARQAEAKRLADDAARKAEDARKAAEDARKAAEVARKAAEDAKRHPGTEPATPTPTATPPTATPPVVAPIAPAAAATSFTVQFELPAKFAKDDVLKTMQTPKACTAKALAFAAKSPLCKGKDCKPVQMSRVDMTCGPQGFAFVQDATHVWLTCTAPATRCADCLNAGQVELTSSSVAHEPTKIVQGCK